METSAFDFDLPDDLIAQQPAEPRDASRLMVLRRASGSIEHRVFRDLPELLAPSDVIVRNNTRVVPARLLGRRAATGGRWEGLFLRVLPSADWDILATTRGKPAPGETILVDPAGDDGAPLRLTLVEKGDAGRWVVRPEGGGGSVGDLLDRFGHVPLPPYIRKGIEGPDDRLKYQTMYASVPGAVAAPTAGLHFTGTTFRDLDARGVGVAEITLHVGLGTFRPIEADQIEQHTLHAEWAELTAATAEMLNARRAAGGRIVAIGTTSARVLETSARGADDPPQLAPFSGETALYLRPGHTFRGLDALLTNFHLPRSSLLVLVSALAGHALTRSAYDEAIRHRYRFYSYGDGMLIL